MGQVPGTIIPQDTYAANQAGPIEIVNNVKIIGGNPNAQVTSVARQISDRQFVVDTVVDELANQSSRSFNALQRSSNLVARGNR